MTTIRARSKRYAWAPSVVWLALLLCGLAPVATATTATPAVAPDRRQWALEQIGASCAWQRTTGSPQVTVAVLDSGVDLAHPDLAGRLRDDGYDFIDGDADPRDENGHGTHVSGIIAAAGNRPNGVAGLAPNVKILPVRVIGAEGSSDDTTIAKGIRYAVDKGAQVINLSLGASLMLSADTPSPEISAAITAAERAGALIVVAAGNDYLPLPNVVAIGGVHVMVVAASNRDDNRSRFSNYGAWVSVVAPGEEIYSTMPTYDVFLTSEVPADERLSNNYDYMSGTSMAAPYVAGLAALLFSAAPGATAEQVKAVIQSTADTSIYDRAPSAVQRLRQLGAGRIDACAALKAVPASAVLPTVAPSAGAYATPTVAAIGTPSATPSSGPGARPSATPSARPSAAPGASPTTRPTASATATEAVNWADPNPSPASSGGGGNTEGPVQTVQEFLAALRAGNLRQARNLIEPARRNTSQLDIRNYLDIADYMQRVGETSYTLVSNQGGIARIEVSYMLGPPPGVSAASQRTTAVFELISDSAIWYVRSYTLPGLRV